MERHIWNRLNHLQVGRYAEYFVKMEFTLFGFDAFTAEVDDKGIDFVIRRNVETFYDIQVKSLRLKGTSGYVFFPKTTFAPRLSLIAALVLFRDGTPPEPYLFPSTAWLSPTPLLVARDYPGSLKSHPEWGVNISRRNQPYLDRFAFE